MHTSSSIRTFRPSLILLATALVLGLFALTLTAADAAPRQAAVAGQASPDRTLRTAAQSTITPVIGEAVSEGPDPSRPEDVNVTPVIGEGVSETPDPSRPEDVNETSLRTLSR